jgi:hypothetical protein
MEISAVPVGDEKRRVSLNSFENIQSKALMALGVECLPLGALSGPIVMHGVAGQGVIPNLFGEMHEDEVAAGPVAKSDAVGGDLKIRPLPVVGDFGDHDEVEGSGRHLLRDAKLFEGYPRTVGAALRCTFKRAI